MARIRSVKPEMWADRKLARLSRDARLLYIALWNQCDEHARMQGDTRYVKGHCLPYDDDLSLTDVDCLLHELAVAGRVVQYEVDADPYLYLPKLGKHQRLEPAKVPSRLPAPPDPLPAPPPPRPSTSRADSSAPRSDRPPRENGRRTPSRGVVAGQSMYLDSSAPRADESEPIVALHVAGSMEHGAWSMGLADEPPTAQTLIGEHVEACSTRPPNNVIGHLSKQVKQLLDEGIAPEHIRQGLVLLRAKALHPATLPSLVNESMNPPSPQQRPSTTDQRFAAGMDLARKFAEQEAETPPLRMISGGPR